MPNKAAASFRQVFCQLPVEKRISKNGSRLWCISLCQCCLVKSAFLVLVLLPSYAQHFWPTLHQQFPSFMGGLLFSEPGLFPFFFFWKGKDNNYSKTKKTPKTKKQQRQRPLLNCLALLLYMQHRQAWVNEPLRSLFCVWLDKCNTFCCCCANKEVLDASLFYAMYAYFCFCLSTRKSKPSVECTWGPLCANVWGSTTWSLHVWVSDSEAPFVHMHAWGPPFQILLFTFYWYKYIQLQYWVPVLWEYKDQNHTKIGKVR